MVATWMTQGDRFRALGFRGMKFMASLGLQGFRV